MAFSHLKRGTAENRRTPYEHQLDKWGVDKKKLEMESPAKKGKGVMKEGDNSAQTEEDSKFEEKFPRREDVVS